RGLLDTLRSRLLTFHSMVVVARERGSEQLFSQSSFNAQSTCYLRLSLLATVSVSSKQRARAKNKQPGLALWRVQHSQPGGESVCQTESNWSLEGPMCQLTGFKQPTVLMIIRGRYPLVVLMVMASLPERG